MAKWSRDKIGEVTLKRLPTQAFKGGKLIIRSFGQVEYLELKFEPIKKVKQSPGCEGVYRIRVAELAVAGTRADGSSWHKGYKQLKNPSPYVKLSFGTHSLETPVAYKRLNAIYQSSKLFPIRKTTPLVIEVKDYSVGFRFSIDKQYKIPFLPIRIGLGMKNEPGFQEIGQQAYLSICPLLKRARYGRVKIKPFGRVRSLLLFFDKMS